MFEKDLNDPLLSGTSFKDGELILAELIPQLFIFSCYKQHTEDQNCLPIEISQLIWRTIIATLAFNSLIIIYFF